MKPKKTLYFALRNLPKPLGKINQDRLFSSFKVESLKVQPYTYIKLALAVLCFWLFIFGVVLGVSFENVNKIHWCFSVQTFLPFLAVFWYLVSTYYYSSKHPLVLTVLINYAVYVFLTNFAGPIIELKWFYVQLSLSLVISVFVYGCIYFGGFRKFTRLLAKHVVSSNHNSLSLVSFSHFWLCFMDRQWPENLIWPVFIKELTKCHSFRDKLACINRLVYLFVTFFYLLCFSYLVSNFFFLYLGVFYLNLYTDDIAYLWLVLCKVFTLGIGLCFICFDSSWSSFFNTFFGDRALHLLGINSPVASTVLKIGEALKGGSVTQGAEAAAETLGGQLKRTLTNTEVQAAANAVGLAGGAAAAIALGNDYLSKKTSAVEQKPVVDTIQSGMIADNSSEDYMEKAHAQSKKLKEQNQQKDIVISDLRQQVSNGITEKIELEQTNTKLSDENQALKQAIEAKDLQLADALSQLNKAPTATEILNFHAGLSQSSTPPSSDSLQSSNVSSDKDTKTTINCCIIMAN